MRSFYMTVALTPGRRAARFPAVPTRALVQATASLLVAAALAGCSGAMTSAAGADGPAQTAYPPPAGTGPVVVLLSGHSGPAYYQPIAAAVAKLGYYAVLLDGKDILTRDKDGRGNLRKAIERAQGSPRAVAGKAAVIGFSRGGGGALVFAADMPELVSAVVAYYPQTNFVSDASTIAERFRVPVLVLAGQRDSYHGCCLVDSMRAMEQGARRRSAQFELVVYPYAEHGFNLPGSGNYRGDDEADAWSRTVEMLRQHQPLR
jgi:dienelactone hydrolase